MDGSNIFFTDVSYNNDIQYVAATISSNLMQTEIVGKRILDFGCGSGDAVSYFCKMGAASVDGVDISSDSLAAAGAKTAEFSNVELIRADLSVYVPKPLFYDVVWSDSVVECLSTDLSVTAQRLADALAPGGIVYMSATENTLLNRFIYFVLGILGRLPRKITTACLGAVIRLRYRIEGAHYSETNLVNKLHYLFVPNSRLVDRCLIRRAFEPVGFEIEYIRKRIKSDINSPEHLEWKMRLPRKRGGAFNLQRIS